MEAYGTLTLTGNPNRHVNRHFTTTQAGTLSGAPSALIAPRKPNPTGPA